MMMLVTLLLLATSFYLGYVSADQMRRIIKEDFNQQQLMLARHTANILEQDFDFLKRELTTLNLSASVEYLTTNVSGMKMVAISVSTFMISFIL